MIELYTSHSPINILFCSTPVNLSHLFFQLQKLCQFLSRIKKRKSFLLHPLAQNLSALIAREEQFLFSCCVREIIERAHTQVLYRSENWSRRLWCRKLTSKIVVSVGQRQPNLDGLTLQDDQSTDQRFKKSLWYNILISSI